MKNPVAVPMSEAVSKNFRPIQSIKQIAKVVAPNAMTATQTDASNGGSVEPNLVKNSALWHNTKITPLKLDIVVITVAIIKAFRVADFSAENWKKWKMNSSQDFLIFR